MLAIKALKLIRNMVRIARPIVSFINTATKVIDVAKDAVDGLREGAAKEPIIAPEVTQDVKSIARRIMQLMKEARVTYASILAMLQQRADAATTTDNAQDAQTSIFELIQGGVAT